MLWGILIIVTGETIYLNSRCSHCKQAGVILFFLNFMISEIIVRYGYLLVPEGERIIPVFSDASEISFLWCCDRT